MYSFGQIRFANTVALTFSRRSTPGWSHSIKQILQKMQQVEKVMLAKYEQVDSLFQEPISKTWIFEIAFFDRIFDCVKV